MSKLHKRLKKHENMTLTEKHNCTCEMCMGLNVGNNSIKKVKSAEKLLSETNAEIEN